MILLYHLIPKMFTFLILCRRLLFYDGFRQKTHFLKCYTLIYFYFWHVPWIAYEYWRGFKSPSAAAVQACFTRCTVSHVQQKRFIMKSIFSRYPCFVINDNNYLCLYTSDTVSRIVKGVFSVAPPYKWTKYQKNILIYFRILWCHFIRCFNPTWPGDLIKKKKSQKKCLLTLTLHKLIPLIAIFLFAEPLWSLTLVGSYTQE